MEKLPIEILEKIYYFNPLECFSCSNIIKFNEINNTITIGKYSYCSSNCFHNYFLYT